MESKRRTEVASTTRGRQQWLPNYYYYSKHYSWILFFLIKAVEWTRTGTRTGSLLDPGVDQFRYLQSRDWEQLVAQSSRFRPGTVNTLSEFQEVGTSSRPSERWKSFRGLRYPGHTQLWLVRHHHHLDMVLHTHNLWTSVPAVTGLWRHNTENTTLEKQ